MGFFDNVGYLFVGGVVKIEGGGSEVFLCLGFFVGEELVIFEVVFEVGVFILVSGFNGYFILLGGGD